MRSGRRARRSCARRSRSPSRRRARTDGPSRAGRARPCPRPQHAQRRTPGARDRRPSRSGASGPAGRPPLTPLLDRCEMVGGPGCPAVAPPVSAATPCGAGIPRPLDMALGTDARRGAALGGSPQPRFGPPAMAGPPPPDRGGGWAAVRAIPGRRDPRRGSKGSGAALTGVPAAAIRTRGRGPGTGGRAGSWRAGARASARPRIVRACVGMTADPLSRERRLPAGGVGGRLGG